MSPTEVAEACTLSGTQDHAYHAASPEPSPQARLRLASSPPRVPLGHLNTGQGRAPHQCFPEFPHSMASISCTPEHAVAVADEGRGIGAMSLEHRAPRPPSPDRPHGPPPWLDTVHAPGHLPTSLLGWGELELCPKRGRWWWVGRSAQPTGLYYRGGMRRRPQLWAQHTALLAGPHGDI